MFAIEISSEFCTLFIYSCSGLIMGGTLQHLVSLMHVGVELYWWWFSAHHNFACISTFGASWSRVWQGLPWFLGELDSCEQYSHLCSTNSCASLCQHSNFQKDLSQLVSQITSPKNNTPIHLHHQMLLSQFVNITKIDLFINITKTITVPFIDITK